MNLDSLVGMEVLLYFLKRIITWALLPIGTALILLSLGLALLMTCRKRLGSFLVVTAGILLVVFSLGWTGFSLVKPLEDKAGPYADTTKLRQIGVQAVVVLSHENIVDGLTPADRWGWTLPRLLEGVRLWRELPNGKLILFGLDYSSSEAMIEFPIQIGVPRDSIIVETSARNTQDEVKLIKALIGSEPFALVTSAVHMPRVMELSRAENANPISCPCGFIAVRSPPTNLLLVPSVEGLRNSEIALHEYYGRIFYLIKAMVLKWF
jgi:uncharacterized SAM-binding protein YcdF (DUF218 family)